MITCIRCRQDYREADHECLEEMSLEELFASCKAEVDDRVAELSRDPDVAQELALMAEWTASGPTDEMVQDVLAAVLRTLSEADLDARAERWSGPLVFRAPPDVE